MTHSQKELTLLDAIERLGNDCTLRDLAGELGLALTTVTTRVRRMERLDQIAVRNVDVGRGMPQKRLSVVHRKPS